MKIEVETGLDKYVLTEVIGEGGASRVYAAQDSAGRDVAIKLLKSDSTGKRRRFKNEMGFLYRNRHENVVPVEDTGFAFHDKLSGPFYVMPRYRCSLRKLLDERATEMDGLKVFGQILDGVEAAHLKDVIHRDLKPENVLYDDTKDRFAIADFGIAQFNEDAILTAIHTGANERLANFQYAAPEQRAKGRDTTAATDIYALGLMLNELFTGEVPQGEDYSKIADFVPDRAFLDGVVSAMIKQRPDERPQSIQAVKSLIQKFEFEAVSQQRLSEIDDAVIRKNEIDDPLALEPPQVVGAKYVDGKVELKLDRKLSPDWMKHLGRIGSFRSMGLVHPERADVLGNDTISVSINPTQAQIAVDIVKSWLPTVSRSLHKELKHAEDQRQYRERQRLEEQLRREQENLEVTKTLKI